MDRETAVAALLRLGALASFDPPEPRTVSLRGRHVTDPDLEALTAFPDLEGIELLGTSVTGAGLAHLQGHARARWLSLDTSPVTDEGLALLQGMHQLES